MKSVLSFVALSLLLLGCPKQAPTVAITGNDDELIDQYSAQLEELRTRDTAGENRCKDACPTKNKVCAISESVCGIAVKKGDRADFQTKCVATQEDCAKFGEVCLSCSK
ncbi:MAG: hypothetical protein K1X64_07040 [Myxococcaceae bacterium]|nr:hypothetical protein [Myxococcaceae bacterium]